MTGATPCHTPMEPNMHLRKTDCLKIVDKKFRCEYQSIIGALMCPTGLTRPDLAHAVNQCSKFMSNPGPAHM
eukprot:1899631-Rhodomonas_salina.1